jgi:hypothetical protein
VISGLDRQLDAALKRASEIFAVFPGFGFYDDSDGPNAWATPTSYFSGRQGTVIFGQQLFQRLLQADPSGIAVIEVIAHEFAPLCQYRTSAYDDLMAGQKTSKRVELHALLSRAAKV